MSFILLVLSLIFPACKKKKGCVNPEAINYCADCNTYDGSCIYPYTLSFWFDSVRYANLVSNGIDSFLVRVEDNHGFSQVVGTYHRDQWLPQEPVCEDSTLLRWTVHYKHSEMPDVCGGGGGVLGGGGTKCWILHVICDTGQGIFDTQVVVGPGATGCHLVKL